jgi:hypothetical protein
MNEPERHVWRAEVLLFVRDYVEATETYRLSASDLGSASCCRRNPSGWNRTSTKSERASGSWSKRHEGSGPACNRCPTTAVE